MGSSAIIVLFFPSPHEGCLLQLYHTSAHKSAVCSLSITSSLLFLYQMDTLHFFKEKSKKFLECLRTKSSQQVTVSSIISCTPIFPKLRKISGHPFLLFQWTLQFGADILTISSEPNLGLILSFDQKCYKAASYLYRIPDSFLETMPEDGQLFA